MSDINKKVTMCVLALYIISAIAFECTENTARISTIGIYLVFAVGVLHFASTKQFFFNSHCASLILLCLYIFILSFHNHNAMSETIAYYCLTCTVLCVFGYNLLFNFEKEKVIPMFLLVFILGTIILDIRVIQSYGGISEILEFSGNGIYERRVGGDIINENTLGLYNANSFFCCLVMFNKRKGHKFYWLYLAVSVLFVAMLLLTASKKAFTFLIAGMILFSILFLRNGKSKNKMAIFVFAILAMAMIVYLIYNVPAFHSVRLRFNELFMTISPDNSFVSETDQTRLFMMRDGISAFTDSPIIGNGTAYSYTIFHGSYSHNNFVELLMNYGLIGFIIYYIPYVFLFTRLYTLIRQKDMYALYFFIFVLMQVVLGVGWVNYYERVIQLYTIFAAAYVENTNLKNNCMQHGSIYIKP